MHVHVLCTCIVYMYTAHVYTAHVYTCTFCTMYIHVHVLCTCILHMYMYIHVTFCTTYMYMYMHVFVYMYTAHVCTCTRSSQWLLPHQPEDGINNETWYKVKQEVPEWVELSVDVREGRESEREGGREKKLTTAVVVHVQRISTWRSKKVNYSRGLVA